jgi:RNA polymerase sigma-70 factor (ECF subfamily)
MNQENHSTSFPTDSTPDHTLVKLAVEGNQEAFNHLYDRYLSQVYRRVAYLIPTEDIDDVTQEVLIAMLQSLKSFRGESKFSTWLRVITNRQIANYYRKNKRILDENPLDPENLKLKSKQTLSETELTRIYIQQGMEKIPEHYQEVILLRFAEGLKFQEIADILGKNLDATKSLFRRAISATREQLGGGHV